MDRPTDGRRPRVTHREPVVEGFSVETGVLSSTQNVQVNFRPSGWYRRDEDVSIQAQVLNLFNRLQRELGLSYVFIAHDLTVVQYVSDRIAVMYLGRVVEVAPAGVLSEQPLHLYTEALLAAIPLPDPDQEAHTAVKGDIPDPSSPPSGCHFHTRCPYAVEECRQRQPELRELHANSRHWVACHRADELTLAGLHLSRT